MLKLEASVRFVKKRDLEVILNAVNVVVGAGQAASQIQNRRKCPIDCRGSEVRLVGDLRKSNESAGQYLY